MSASQKLIDLLNEQVANEMHAHLKYLSVAAYFEGETLPSLAEFFSLQAAEEHEHAMKFFKFLVNVGAPVRIPEVPAPPTGFSSAEEAVARSLESEQTVTAQIMELVRTAEHDRNRLALRFLDWFVEEQQEEENLMASLLSVVRRAGPDRLLQVEALIARGGLRREEPAAAEVEE